MLSASTLMACTVWMLSEGRKAAATAALIPGMFMTSVVACFILWTSSDKGQPVGLVPGGMPLPAAIGVAVVVAFVFAAYVFRRGRGMASDAGGTPPSICPPEP